MLAVVNPRRITSPAIAAGAALALADGSIVVLALPELLSALDTTVEGVAAVIGVYTAALALALLPAEALRRRLGAAHLGAAGLIVFGGASLLCGLADSLPLMLTVRAAQALGGAATLVAAFALLDAGARRGGGGHLWMLAAIGGAAAGPAIGGALTQAFSWSAIFFAQVPICLAGALACLARAHAEAHRPPRTEMTASGLAGQERGLRRRAAVGLALLSAASTAVLFLLVLVLVAGWSYEPLAGAALLTVLPVAAITAMRIRGDPQTRAAVGSLLVAGGVAALAPMTTASAWWAVAPQLAAGLGIGLALPALSETLLPERTPADAARVLTVRHVGITVALLLVAPVISARLDTAIDEARQREVAVLLDARIDPVSKFELIGRLAAVGDGDDPRGDLQRSFAEYEDDGSNSERHAQLAQMQRRADETIVTAVADTFRPPFLIAAAFALAAAGVLMPRRRERRLIAIAAVAVALPLATAAVALAVRPEPVTISSPCKARDLPPPDGIPGSIEAVTLRALDRAACRFGSSREELALALADDAEARRYENEHGVDPRSPISLLEAALGEGVDSGSLESLLRDLLP